MHTPETTDERLSKVLASYLEEAETAREDRARLRALRGRYLADYLDLTSELQSYFEDEDAIGSRLGHPRESLADLDRYTGVVRIGQGAMGVVYRAFDRQLKRWVALKMGPSLDLVMPGEAQRFRSEAQSMARLKHPNIVRVFDVQGHRGHTFLTMELVAGGSLDRHLDRFDGDQRSIAKLMVDIARGVHHAHQRGILHRDLKPSNILVAIDEHGLQHAYVSDFGLAKPLDADELRTGKGAAKGSSHRADYGKVVGTASYMSPEQASGKDATTLSDVYGLGGILYALLTGRAPFRGESVDETLEQVKNLALTPGAPREANRNLDRTLEAICLKCLEKNPDNRYRSAEGLAKDLDRWLAYRSTEARPRNAVGRTGLWCRRNPLGLGLVVVILALATLAGLDVADRLQAPLRAQLLLAEQRAEILRLRLTQLSRAVAATAEDRTLGELLGQRDVAGLQPFIEETGNGRVDLNGVSPFESWFVVDIRDGAILARWPAMSAETGGVDFRGRDYLQGLSGLSEASDIYVSRVFRALSDELHKFGISAWVRNEDGKMLGALVATVTTSAEMGFPEMQSDEIVMALLARRDSFVLPGETGLPPEKASDFLILLHPAYERRIEPVWFSEDYFEALQVGIAEDYRDPAALLGEEAKLEYGGSWVAVFAPVKDSEFVVMVQQRHLPSIPTSLWVAVVALFSGVLLAALAARHLRNRRAEGLSIPGESSAGKSEVADGVAPELK